MNFNTFCICVVICFIEPNLGVNYNIRRTQLRQMVVSQKGTTATYIGAIATLENTGSGIGPTKGVYILIDDIGDCRFGLNHRIKNHRPLASLVCKPCLGQNVAEGIGASTSCQLHLNIRIIFVGTVHKEWCRHNHNNFGLVFVIEVNMSILAQHRGQRANIQGILIAPECFPIGPHNDGFLNLIGAEVISNIRSGIHICIKQPGLTFFNNCFLILCFGFIALIIQVNYLCRGRLGRSNGIRLCDLLSFN